MLASRINGTCINLGELVEKHSLYAGVDERRETFIADMEKVSAKVEEVISRSKQPVIIEGHFAVHTIDPEKVSRVFVLRLHPEELKTILEKRGYKYEKIWENLASEILDVCLFEAVKVCGIDKICEIDITGKNVEEVVKEMLLILNNKKKCRSGWIDWLGRLETEQKLDEYLKHF